MGEASPPVCIVNEAFARLAFPNENPLGTSPMAVEYAQRALADMFWYPDGGLALRRKLAERFNLKLENVIAGAGSEGIMANIVRTFLCDDDEVLTTDAAFSGFQVLARSRGVEYRTVPYRNWGYDLAAMAESITDRTKLIYLANPNNPTITTVIANQKPFRGVLIYGARLLSVLPCTAFGRAPCRISV